MLIVVSPWFFAETMSVTVNVSATDLSKAGLGTCYSCNSQDSIREGAVSQTLWNVLIQAFVANGSKSEESEYMRS